MGCTPIFKNPFAALVKQLQVQTSQNRTVSILMQYGELKNFQHCIDYIISVLDGNRFLLLRAQLLINGDNAFV